MLHFIKPGALNLKSPLTDKILIQFMLLCSVENVPQTQNKLSRKEYQEGDNF